tara:strand:+ start:29 stop:1255 length:1227 start_codon:yes stop_codon:yes gene_type:complete
MKNNTLSTIIIFCCIYLACGSNSKTITIKGTILNPVGDKAFFNYPDTTYEANVDENGKFEISFLRDSSEYLSFRHGRESTSMYLRPEDDISLELDTEQFDETIKYENSPQSSFLAYKYMLNEKKDFYGEALYLKDDLEYQQYLEDHQVELLEQLNLIDDKDFKVTELENLNTSIDRYHKQKQNLSEKSKEELAYLWDVRVLYQEYNFYGLLDSSSENEFKKTLMEYEKKVMASLNRIKNWNDSSFVKEKEKISSSINNWVERKSSHDNMPNVGDQAINFAYPDQYDKMMELASFKGSMVYVDVWATWCGPCIAEIPSLKKLQKDYEDKDIVFLSVSVDTDRDAWEKMIKDDDLGGVHLWADGWSEITKSYAIFGIPRFMLIDENGNMISVDAPRPSSDDIRGMFNENI